MSSLILATVVAFSPAFHQQVTEVQWEADYGKALEDARNAERPLLVVIEDGQEKKAGIDAQFVSQNRKTLDNYKLCKVDANTEYGKKVAESFGATQLPHTAIIDKEGETVIYKKRGKFAKGEFASTLKTYRTGSRKLAFRSGGLSREGTIFSRGNSAEPYCPACQRNAMNF